MSTRRAPVARRLEDAALELFAARGFDATTVDDLAAAGGVGRRTFFRYYPTKLDVVHGELDEALALLVGALDAHVGDDPVAAARTAFGRVNDYPDDALPALRRRLALIEDVPDLGARAASRYRSWEQAVAADAARRWALPPGSAAPEVFARAAVGAMRAVVAVWAARPAASAGELRDLVDEAFDALAVGFHAGSRAQ